MFAGLLLSILGYLIQVRPRFFNRYFGVDVWRNLSIVDYIRKNKRLPQYLPKYMLKGPFDYPPFLNIILALFPKKFLEDYQGFISPFFDAINNLIVFIVTYMLTKNLSIAIFAQLIYIVSPMMVIENASLTARSLGNLLFSLAFLSTIFYSINHSLFLFIFAIFFTTLLLFSQKMASQVLFFISFLFSVLEGNFIYLVIFGLSVILAILLSRGFYLKVLAGHLSVLKYFRMIIKNRYAHQIRGIIPPSKNRDFIEMLKALIREHPLFALIVSCPFITMGFLVSLWILLYPKNSFLIHYTRLSLVSYKFALWLAILYCLGIITAQIKPFQFLGEGMKYLMYAGLPSSFILSIITFDLVTRKGNLIFLFLIICIMLITLFQIFFIQNRGIINDRTRTVTSSLRRIMNFLQSQSKEVRLATIPFSLADAVAYFTKSNILSSDSAHVLASNPDYLDYYPVLRRPLEEILNKHNINYLLIDRNYVNLEELKLSKINIALEVENLCLMKR